MEKRSESLVTTDELDKSMGNHENIVQYGMKITVITLFPDMVMPFFTQSIVKKAQEKGLVEVNVINLRDFAIDERGTVDDRPYGGGPGMVLRPEPVVAAIESVRAASKDGKRAKVLLTSARGTVFDQEKAKEFAMEDEIVLVAGHYEGVDARVLEHIDEEISIGEFVLTGGELAAGVIADAVVRLLPGVLKKEEAIKDESFEEVSVTELAAAVGQDDLLDELAIKGQVTVKLLEYPQYTRPDVFEGKAVPEELKSGDPKKIRRWQLQQAFLYTKKQNPQFFS